MIRYYTFLVGRQEAWNWRAIISMVGGGDVASGEWRVASGDGRERASKGVEQVISHGVTLASVGPSSVLVL